VVDSAPRLSQQLLDAIVRVDDGKLPIAEVRRRIGAEADRLGLARPSYQRVRELVHESRRLRARVRTSDVLLDVAFRVRPVDAVLEHLSSPNDTNLPSDKVSLGRLSCAGRGSVAPGCYDFRTWKALKAAWRPGQKRLKSHPSLPAPVPLWQCN
jgi:hypothetical protein